jgi:hypothetical protein
MGSEVAVGSGSNGVPTQTAYYLANWNKNSCAWATGVQVMTEKECLSGINSLGWGITKIGWTGNSGTVPKGCSFDPKSKKGHFNSHSSGHGRSDLRPLCKSKSYDDKCGCMYAYCEDKYGVGNTNNCCEFYRDPQSSHCNGREAAVGFDKDDANNEAAVSAVKSCDIDSRNPSSACPGDEMCTCKNVYVGGGQQRVDCFCATPTLATAEIAVAAETSSTSPVVYAFAALGFGVITYGAAKHYYGAKTEGERVPLNV